MSIQGRVAKILNEFQVVISVGAKQGVKSGMKFIIYEEGEEIKDPQTGDSLGALEMVKGEVEVLHVQENVSIAQSRELKKESTPTVLSAKLAEVTPSSRLGPAKDREKLFVRQSDISGLRAAGPIVVGDLVRSVE